MNAVNAAYRPAYRHVAVREEGSDDTTYYQLHPELVALQSTVKN